MKRIITILFTVFMPVFFLFAIQINAQNQSYKIDVNSGAYQQLVQEAQDSEKGLPADEMARFFSQNLMLQSTLEEARGVRLIVLFMDDRGSVINKYTVQADEMSNRQMRLGRLINSSQIAGIVRESEPSTTWIPVNSWLTDNPTARNMNEIERIAGQMAIKIGITVKKEMSDKLFALAFAVMPPDDNKRLSEDFDTPSNNRMQNQSTLITVFPLIGTGR